MLMIVERLADRRFIYFIYKRYDILYFINIFTPLHYHFYV